MKNLTLMTLIAVGVFALNGCKKDYFDLSANPNASSTATPALVLTNAMATTGNFPITSFDAQSAWLGYWSPSGSYAINNTDAASYQQTTGYGDNLWRSVYHNLEDYAFVESEATKLGSYFYIGCAKVMKVYDYQMLVDVFNNVPYSEALQGTTNLLPKYDNSQLIYENMAKQLDVAVVLFNRSDAIGLPASDIMFAGDNTQWIKFANTLKLRLLIHQTQIVGRTPYIQAEINKIVANGGGFLTTDAGVNPGYSASTGKQNPFWSLNYNTSGTYIGDYWKASRYSIDFGNINNDPRTLRIYSTVNGNLVGGKLGAINNPVGSAISGFGPGVLQSVAQPSILISAAESNFLQAEAALRTLLPGNVQTFFNAGVQASFDYLGATGATTYYTQANNKNTNYAAATTPAEQLSIIIRQKWVANNTVMPLEAYSDYRRLGLPSDIPISISTFLDVPMIPTRFLYPTVEYSTNAANVALQGTINHHTSKIFWMP